MYEVTDKQVVKPTDVHVVEPVPGRTMLTLITCHPFRSNKQRLIVSAERVDITPVKTT
ncbi:sortase [Paenibacillus hemerocallicola]